jgi:hypothetical protein
MNDTLLNAVRIQFLGQCIALGRDGIGSERAYPYLVRQALGDRFPQTTFKIHVTQLAHPRGLKALLRARVVLFRPDIVVVSLPAYFTSIPTRVDLLTHLAPELMVTARSFLQKVDARTGRNGKLEQLAKRTARPTAFYQPLDLEEYERLAADALRHCMNTSTCRIVLVGPGGFNEYSEAGTLKSPADHEAVNEMVIRLGHKLGLPVVDVSGLIGQYDSSVFLPASHAWSLRGQQLASSEIASVLALQVSALDTSSKGDI